MRLQVIFNESESDKIMKLLEYSETDNLHNLFVYAIDTMYEAILVEEEANGKV